MVMEFSVCRSVDRNLTYVIALTLARWAIIMLALAHNGPKGLNNTVAGRAVGRWRLVGAGFGGNDV
jgi:hypothetical protein